MLHEVVDLPLIGARLHRCRMGVDSHFRTRGLEPRYVMRSDENGTAHGLVAAGVGVGIVAQLAVNTNDERVVALELEPGYPHTRSRWRGTAIVIDSLRQKPSLSWQATCAPSSSARGRQS